MGFKIKPSNWGSKYSYFLVSYDEKGNPEAFANHSHMHDVTGLYLSFPDGGF